MKIALAFTISIWSCFCFAQMKRDGSDSRIDPDVTICHGPNIVVTYFGAKEGVKFNETVSTSMIDATNFDQQKFLDDVQRVLGNQPSKSPKFITIRLLTSTPENISKLSRMLENKSSIVARECFSRRVPLPQSYEDWLDWLEESIFEEMKRSDKWAYSYNKSLNTDTSDAGAG